MVATGKTPAMIATSGIGSSARRQRPRWGIDGKSFCNDKVWLYLR
jgi:hypothetical protein